MTVEISDIENLIEALAAQEHERWAHWQRHMHAQGRKRHDGALLIPAELVSRWERQFDTPYALLSDAEKQSDRDQVMKYFPLIQEWLARSRLA
uniref:Uncharacterized protein n=2 Tax=Rhizobium rhizogenes TaxID=359 RepID=A0A7S5DT18_RHIRH|nr:hypothetical protein pC6.5d_719 [Rhizobium rhizogenes]